MATTSTLSRSWFHTFLSSISLTASVGLHPFPLICLCVRCRAQGSVRYLCAERWCQRVRGKVRQQGELWRASAHVQHAASCDHRGDGGGCPVGLGECQGRCFAGCGRVS